jgi:hypothetical protein
VPGAYTPRVTKRVTQKITIAPDTTTETATLREQPNATSHSHLRVTRREYTNGQEAECNEQHDYRLHEKTDGLVKTFSILKPKTPTTPDRTQKNPYILHAQPCEPLGAHRGRQPSVAHTIAASKNAWQHKTTNSEQQNAID